jgi:hypothetical protein
MKYLYIVLIGIMFTNCSDKNEVVVVENPTPKIEEKIEEVVSIATAPVEIVESANVNDKTLIADERKIMKNIKSDVPARCGMWSDGCNVCTRTSSSKASCTTYPACHNRMVSCLKWN